MAIYLEYEGIKGNVTAEGYQDFINILSFNFAVSRGISMEPGNVSNRESTRPSLSEINLVKNADNSVTALFKGAVTGAAGKPVLIHFCKTGDDKVQEYMTYELENCLISSYAITAEDEGEPVETLSLSYTKLLVHYCDTKEDNSNASKQVCGYDLVTAKPM